MQVSLAASAVSNWGGPNRSVGEVAKKDSDGWRRLHVSMSRVTPFSFFGVGKSNSSSSDKLLGILSLTTLS